MVLARRLLTPAAPRLTRSLEEDGEDDEEQNIPLESGDVVYIPSQQRTISVSGQVLKL